MVTFPHLFKTLSYHPGQQLCRRHRSRHLRAPVPLPRVQVQRDAGRSHHAQVETQFDQIEYFLDILLLIIESFTVSCVTVENASAWHFCTNYCEIDVEEFSAAKPISVRLSQYEIATLCG